MKRLILILSVLSLIMGKANADDIAIAREGVKWVYYDYKYHNVDGTYIPTYYPVVYEFKSDETDPESDFKVLWEDRTYEIYTGEVKREITPIALVCDKYIDFIGFIEHAVCAKRFGSQEPLTGQYISADEDGLLYKVYSFPYVEDHFNRTKLTKKQREALFTFTSSEMIDMEDGTQRKCLQSVHSAFKLIEGIGFVRTDWDEEGDPYVNLNNFIDLDIRETTYRLLSHVIENGEIIFKGEQYDEIKEYAYDPDNPEGFSGVEEIEVATPTTTTNGIYYDMQGRRIAEPTQPGIYIRDGKKIIVR